MKKALLVLAVVPTLFAWGCGGGLWNNLHVAAYHLSDLTQWIAAINQLTTT